MGFCPLGVLFTKDFVNCGFCSLVVLFTEGFVH